MPIACITKEFYGEAATSWTGAATKLVIAELIIDSRVAQELYVQDRPQQGNAAAAPAKGRTPKTSACKSCISKTS